MYDVLLTDMEFFIYLIQKKESFYSSKISKIKAKKLCKKISINVSNPTIFSLSAKVNTGIAVVSLS